MYLSNLNWNLKSISHMQTTDKDTFPACFGHNDQLQIQIKELLNTMTKHNSIQ
jgi:hypothetical protein